MRSPKLLKRPTTTQRSILGRMANGAIILICRPNPRSRYELTGDGEPTRVVTARTAASMRFAGWVWAGADRPSYVITMAGRAAAPAEPRPTGPEGGVT